MKCRVETVWDRDADKILKQYPCLNKFDLEIEKKTEPIYETIRDENGNKMKQQVGTYTKNRPHVTLNTMEDLCRFIQTVGQDLVVSYNEDECCVEIYDSYRE